VAAHPTPPPPAAAAAAAAAPAAADSAPPPAAADRRVVVMAATNRPSAVDPALRRPGRSVRASIAGVSACSRAGTGRMRLLCSYGGLATHTHTHMASAAGHCITVCCQLPQV
jgi:hypothetical protein